MKIKDLFGKKIGRLTPVSSIRGSETTHRKWVCVCECGNTITTTTNQITSGRTLSCGCLRRDVTRDRAKTHGKSKSKIYNAWCKMRDRCYNVKNNQYNNYGARGISVCEEWRNSADEFIKWAISNGWKEGLQIDRINNDGDYKPENCRIVTNQVNANNRRNNVILDFRGEKKTVKDWSRDDRCVVKYPTLLARIQTHGWQAEKAITTPARRWTKK